MLRANVLAIHRSENIKIVRIPNLQASPWECHSYGNPMVNVPWDGTGINCYGMGMGQINMSHGQPCQSG